MDRIVNEDCTYHDLIGIEEGTLVGLDLVMSSPERKRLHLEKYDMMILNFRNAGYSVREIAKHLGLAPSTVYRALKRINKNRALRKGFLIMD